jgi:glutamate racemase
MQNQANSPIGIFDSGVGGLTVVKAVKELLPNEQIIYYGDTAHVPYGDKSKETISAYSARIAEYLINLGCKVIVIACNSASANAFEKVSEVAEGKAYVLNVIDPAVEHVKNSFQIKNVGVIGTKSTINSAAYETRLHKVRSDLQVESMSTPLFVPMIEEGFVFDNISNAIIKAYLEKEIFEHIDTLILGCTHYPIIKNQILKFFNFNIEIIDSAKVVALALQKLLREKNLLNETNVHTDHYFVSDYTENFEGIAKMFLEKKIQLETKNIF